MIGTRPLREPRRCREEDGEEQQPGQRAMAAGHADSIVASSGKHRHTFFSSRHFL
jgi:hypothetical protein